MRFDKLLLLLLPSKSSDTQSNRWCRSYRKVSIFLNRKSLTLSVIIQITRADSTFGEIELHEESAEDFLIFL